MDIREVHNEAMYKAELGDIQKYMRNLDAAQNLYAEAYELEKSVALSALEKQLGEPTISILLKSAASLAMRCELNRDAEKLIGLALSGEPPRDIAEELRNMLETVNFRRHLDLKGIVLQEDEVQLVIAGRGVGYGYAKSDDVLNRVETFQKMAVRTIERKAGRVFRKAGSIPGELKNACQPYISAPNAASMAFRMKFGSLASTTLAGFSRFEEVIEDINDNIELIGKGDLAAVRRNIVDDSYFSNFIGLTKQLAPDGENVNLFGITSITQGKERMVQLTSHKSEISSIIKHAEIIAMTDDDKKKNLIETNHENIIGILSAADNLGKVRITTNKGEKIMISVPDGLSDIVKNYWEEEVSIIFQSKGRKKVLLDIDKV
ncbi:hypothetical protein [Bacteroides cellulosilyticus]|jgi:hypothetical protein|uniref:hypothetical protein n=2 Tax=Bacteroides cellulosilyticus TaxID=246787 RepID=UPI00321A1AB9